MQSRILTPTFDGNDRIKLFFPSYALRRHASWLYSQILDSPPANLINSTIRSRSLRDARRAGEKTTISRPSASARQAQKIAIENVFPKRRGVLHAQGTIVSMQVVRVWQRRVRA